MNGAGGSGGLLNESLHLGSALLNLTARQQTQQDILYITDNRVTDSQLTTSLWLNTLLGSIFFLAFCILQRSVFPQHYRFRLVSASVTVKPRDLPTRGLYSLWAWLWTAWDVNDDEIMRSSGLDAVVMIKSLQMGVEIFAPLAFVGCIVLLPVHYQYKNMDTSTGFNRSQLMQLTIAALPRGSDVMWVHFVLTIMYNLWVMWVLSRYFKDFVLVRQHYLSKGDDPNYWMALTQQADAEYVSRKVRKMLAEINQTGSNEDSGGGAQPPPPQRCTSPQPTDRVSISTGRQGWLDSVADRMSRLAQRMSRTNLFNRSSDSYKPYTNEFSPHHSPLGHSPEPSEHRVTHVNWAAAAAAGSHCATAAGAATSTSGSDGVAGSSLRNSKDSLEGPASSGPATARGSDSSSHTGNNLTGGGSKRWSSGSSAGAGSAAVGSSEGGSAYSHSSRGGDGDPSSGSGSSGGGGGAAAAAAPDNRRLRAPGSRGGRGGSRAGTQQPQGDKGAAGSGTAPTYQTINELHSMTTAQATSSGFPGQLWPPVPKHMRTITEDSLEYRLDSSLGASRPSSRGGLANPVHGLRTSSSSGADGSPCSVSAHAAALAAAVQAAAGSTSGLLSTDGSGSSSSCQALQGAGASGSSAGAFGGTCGPSILCRASGVAPTAASSTGQQPQFSIAAGQQGAGDDTGTPTIATAAASRAASLAGGGSGQASSREGAHLRASITSLDSIEERSSVGTCIIHASAPSSPGLAGCSNSSSRSGSPPLPDAAVCGSEGGSRRNTGWDVSLTGGMSMDGLTLQGPFAEAAMAAGSDSSRSGSGETSRDDTGPLEPVGSGQQLQGRWEVTLSQPVSHTDVTISMAEPAHAGDVQAAAGAAAGAGGGHGPAVQQRRKHARDCSVDFSKQHLPDLSTLDVALLEPPRREGSLQRGSAEQLQAAAAGTAFGAARASPFANSADSIAISIAAAGVAVAGSQGPWGHATSAAAAADRKMAASDAMAASGRQQGSSSQGSNTTGQAVGQVAAIGLKQQAIQLTQQQQQASTAAPQPPLPSQQQQQQLQGSSVHSSQQWPSRHGSSNSQQGSSNGSTGTGTSGRQHRQRVQQHQPSLHSSSEPSPGSQGGIPPCWNASWQHHHHQQQQQQQQQQQAQARTEGGAGAAYNPKGGSSSTSRTLSPVGGSFVALQPQAQAVAGAAVGAGQELTPAALAAAAGTGTAMAEAAAERLQQMLQEGLDAQGGSGELSKKEERQQVAYHWWKELPADQLRKCDSVISEQQAWLDVGDRPLLAKPSVRFRKTINTTRMGPDGQEYPISVNAQHYAVLVTDVQPRCPYPEMEEEHMRVQSSLYDRTWNWLGIWIDRLTPRPRSWGLGGYRRYSGDAHLATDSWPFGDQFTRASLEQQMLAMGLQQHRGGASRLSLEQQPLSGPGTVVAGGMALTPGGQLRSRRHSQVASGQLSTDGPADGTGLLPSCGGMAPISASGLNPLTRLSHSSHLSHLSLLPDVRPDEQMQYLHQQIQWALHKLSQDVAAGLLSPKAREKRLAKILKVQADFQDKVAASERMATISRETSALMSPVGRTASQMRLPLAAVPGSGYTSAAMTPTMGVSRCSSFRSAVPRAGAPARGPEGAVAGAAVGNPDFAATRAAAGGSTGGLSFSAAPTPRSPTPLSLQDGSEARVAGSTYEQAAGAAGAVPHQVLQHRLPPTLISSSSLQQRLQRMRVGMSARLMRSGPGLDTGDLPLHMYSSASCSHGMLRPQATLESHSSAPMPAAAAAAGVEQGASRSGGSGSGGGEGAAASRRAGGPALLTPEMSGELFMQPTPQQQRQQQVSPERQAVGLLMDDQPTPAAVAAAEAASLPPRYNRQQPQRSPPLSPQPPGGDSAPTSASSAGGSISTSTPATEGTRDSSESALSHQSYGGRRPVLQFSRPHPPELPNSAAAAAGPGSSGAVGTSPRAQAAALASQGGSNTGSRVIGGVLTHGASGRSLRQSGAGAGSHGSRADQVASGPSSKLPSGSAVAGSSGSSSSLPPSGLQPHSGGGSSGGGAPAGAGSSGGSAQLHPTPPLPLPSRTRSGRSITQCDRLPMGPQQQQQRGISPDHLAVIIPPCPQMPPSRSGTPGAASAGGHCPVPVIAHPSVCPLNVPPQPWGLPPDAALINTSFSSSPLGSWGPSSRSHRATTGGSSIPGAYPQQQQPQQQQQQGVQRWSAGGLAEQRSHLAHAGPAAGCAVSRMASPLQSEPELMPALTAGSDGLLIVKSPGSRPGSRPASSMLGTMLAPGDKTGAELGDAAVNELYYTHLMQDQHEHCMIPPHVRGWARVRWAYRTRKLFDLPQRESYSIVSATFSRLFPEDFDRAIPVINHRGVDKLLLLWEAAVAALERAELKRRRTGREPVRLTGCCGTLFGCCSEGVGCGCCACSWESIADASPGCCLLEDRMVKIIPELQDTIQSLEAQIEQARRKAFSSAFTPSWFVLFKSQSAAMMAASTRIYAHDNTKFQVHPAPGPEEVNWQHVWMSGFERDLRTAFTWPLTLLVVLFPITLITSAASRLEYVFCPQGSDNTGNVLYWQWYCSGRDQGSSLQSFMRAFITGWLPSLLLNLWLAMIMPRLVYLLVQMEGSCFSLSALERRIGAIFFYWDVYNMFLQGTLGSTFFQQVHSIIQNPEKLPNILGAALPDSSNFFMQFIAMRALFLIWLRLCVPHGGVWQNWLHYCCCPRICCSTCNTERDKSLTYGPRTPRYGFEMGHMLLMYLIALAFAIVSPLLLPFSVVWFAFAWLSWRHNLSYVYQRKYESGGMMWIFLFSRIIMCLVIGQLFTFCVLVVRGAYWQAFLIIAFMPAMTLRYYRYCQARYAKGVEYGVPLDVANKAARARVPALAYIPPPLQDRSWGWYPEWQKIWEGWGMPTYAAA